MTEQLTDAGPTTLLLIAETVVVVWRISCIRWGELALQGLAEDPVVIHPPMPPAARRRWHKRPTWSTMKNVVSTWISPKAAKGTPSEIAGRGLVAVEAIGKDEVVAVKGGHIVTTEQLRAMPERLQNSEVQIADYLHLAAVADEEYEAVMLFINHSGEPNVGFAGNVVLVAMRDIDVGEELTTDYALFDDYEGAMACTCGRTVCRRRIDGRDWQRPELQERYRGYFSWHLDRKMRNDSGS